MCHYWLNFLCIFNKYFLYQFTLIVLLAPCNQILIGSSVSKLVPHQAILVRIVASHPASTDFKGWINLLV